MAWRFKGPTPSTPFRSPTSSSRRYCFFEENSMLCDKELSDRGDLAELLRLQSELLLRTDYLKNANLFASDVQSEHDQYERDTLIEKVFQADSS